MSIAQQSDTFADDTLFFKAKRRNSGLHLVFAINSETVARYCNGSAATGPYSRDNQSVQSLRIPDVSGLSPVHAALAYAEAGWYVLPVAKGKHPGSIVGTGWPEQSTRDCEQIRRWWADHPNAGIALHVGRSGAVVFDLDLDSAADLPPALWLAMQSGQRQHTRDGSSVRGHYVFACEVDSFRNSAGGFMRYGEVRCRNGVIIVEPSTHAKAVDGGLYRWHTTGELPELPDVLRDLLSISLPGDESADPKSLEELAAFLADHKDSNRPNALKGQLTTFASETDAGASRHDSMCKAVVWAFREAMIGCYPAQHAYDELCSTFETVKPESVGNGEFDRIACWAASQAELADPDQTRERLNRHVWPAPDTPLLVAKRVAEHAEANGYPLRRWRGGWHRWDGTAWPEIAEERLRADLYQLLANAQYLKTVKVPQAMGGGTTQTATEWNPDKAKLDKLIDALKGTVALSDDTDAPCWLDGRTDAVIAFGNTLLRVADRAEIPCAPEYFNTFALPFDYDAGAKMPRRWLAFLDSVWPGDSDAIALLQEWFGYVISGRTDLQKMLLMIGPTRSGKGTIDKVLAALVGKPNYLGASAKYLQGDFGLEPLLDKSLAVFSDDRVTVNGKALVETILKITGEDDVTVNRKYRQSWAGRLSARLMLISNEIPTLPDNSRAIAGRMLPLRMTKSFLGREDTGLAKAVGVELPGILLWALDGLDRLIASGGFTQPASGQILNQILSDSAAPITQFVEDMCRVSSGERADENLTVGVKALYNAWKSWCEQHGYNSGNEATMGKALFSAYGEKMEKYRPRVDGKPTWTYKGIALRTNSRVIASGPG